MSAQKFRLGITGDFLDSEGRLSMGDIGLAVLDGEPRIEYEFFAENLPEVTPQQADRYDAIVALAPKFTARTFEGLERLTAIGRFGVGFDRVDVAACTRAGVVLFITPDGVLRPVAQSVLALMLALANKLLLKDRSIRAGRWQDKARHTGVGLTGRTLGLIGAGNIGAEVLRLVAPFGMRHLVFDPYADRAAMRALGAELVDLPVLLAESDFVSVNCPLNDHTRGMIGERELAAMKPTAFLINTARGPIVDQRALTEALRAGAIAGAGLDVFEREPIAPDDPLLGLENVVLAPHNLCYTDEVLLGNGKAAFSGVLQIARGEAPPNVVNPEVLKSEILIAKLRRHAKSHQE